ncbi:MAG: 50S ribosomal protein L5 [Planctomycetota bacterium]|nr:MAG: 50S ribosomal protein L5 [Planctomycetota bacterium]
MAKQGSSAAVVDKAPPPRLKEKYDSEIREALKQRFGYKNDLAVPRLEKIVISMGVGKALQNPKRLEEAQKHLTLIAGQKAVITRARRSVSNFRLREGQAIGCKVTLRRARMYEFLDRLISVAIPRIRDFRGLSPKAFDGRGNYSMGLSEQTVFPEVDADRMEFTQGMNIAICTTAKTDEEARELIRGFGFPFKKD